MALEKLAVTQVKDVKALIKEYCLQLNLLIAGTLAPVIRKEWTPEKALTHICDELAKIVIDMRDYAVTQDPSDPPKGDSGPIKVVVRRVHGQQIICIVHVSTLQEAQDLRGLLTHLSQSVQIGDPKMF